MAQFYPKLSVLLQGSNFLLCSLPSCFFHINRFLLVLFNQLYWASMISAFPRSSTFSHNFITYHDFRDEGSLYLFFALLSPISPFLFYHSVLLHAIFFWAGSFANAADEVVWFISSPNMRQHWPRFLVTCVCCCSFRDVASSWPPSLEVLSSPSNIIPLRPLLWISASFSFRILATDFWTYSYLILPSSVTM